MDGQQRHDVTTEPVGDPFRRAVLRGIGGMGRATPFAARWAHAAAHDATPSAVTTSRADLDSLTPEVSAMSRIRWLVLAMAVLVGITPVMASPGFVGAEPNPNQPIVLPVDDTFPAPRLTAACGFAVTAHVFGTVTIVSTPAGVYIEQIRFQHVFSGPGGSVAYNRVESVKITTTTSPDGTLVETITATGTLPYHSVVPGHGSIANNSGREVVQITWQYDEELGEYVPVDFQVLFDAGPNNELTDADFVVICDELA